MLGASHAGSWYPTGRALEEMLEETMEEVAVARGEGLVRTVIVPHAGYRFCLKTSLHAFAHVDPSLYDTVIVLGPSHRVSINCCTIADAVKAECPLGDIDFDMDIIAHLTGKHKRLFEKLDTETAEIEHSLEMEFPQIKYIFKSKPFKLVPIMVGHITPEKCAEVARALNEVCNDRTLIVISSDFSHWGARFGYQYLPEGAGAIHERIEQLDREATHKISTGDPAKFWQYLRDTRNTICGKFPILIAMNMFPNGRYEWPHYSHSSNITAMNDSCVSYMAGVIRTE